MNLLSSIKAAGGPEQLLNPTLLNGAENWAFTTYVVDGSVTALPAGGVQIICNTMPYDDTGIRQNIWRDYGMYRVKAVVKFNTDATVQLYSYNGHDLSNTFTAVSGLAGQTKEISLVVGKGLAYRVTLRLNSIGSVDVLSMSTREISGSENITETRIPVSTSRGKALFFTEDSQYIVLPNDPKLNITGDMTIKASVMITEIRSNAAICSKGGGSINDMQWLLTVESSVAKFYVSDGTTTGAVAYNIKPFVWYDVVARMRGQNYEISVNQSAWEGGIIANPKSVVAEPVTIGTYSKYQGSYNHRGFIDRVTIWDRALSLAEAEAYDPNGLVADYRFEGNVQDSSPNALHGTANGLMRYIGSSNPRAAILTQKAFQVI